MKTTITILSIAVVFLFSCKAKKKTTDVPGPDTITVMKPEPKKFVTDDEHLLTDIQIMILDSMISAHEKETTNEIAVVTTDLDTAIAGEPDGLKTFSLKLFNKLGVGKKDKDNGVGLLICANVRKLRIETGKGLTGKLTDKEAQRIIDEVITPLFRKQNYFTGIRNGLEEIINEIK